jgi:hypothetical protein
VCDDEDTSDRIGNANIGRLLVAVQKYARNKQDLVIVYGC